MHNQNRRKQTKLNKNSMNPTNYKYYAFISYKSEDSRWARRLQRKLESYRLPSTVCNKYTLDSKPFKRNPIFYAETDIQPGPLSNELIKQLDQSKFLIVICSPHATLSKWVGKEIEHFIRTGKQDRILLFIIDGEPYSEHPKKECVHPVIKAKLPEILGANIHEKGDYPNFIKRERAYVQIITKMLGIDFDTLWKRRRRRLIRQITLNISLAILVVLSLVITWCLNQPFNAHVILHEQTEHNPHLYDEDGTISIVLKGDTLKQKIDSVRSQLCFKNIPGKYRNTNAALYFELFGYDSVKTTKSLKKEIVVPIKRKITTYGEVKGIVKDRQKDIAISNVEIDINGCKVKTDKNGCFFLTIPLNQQRSFYSATMTYEGKQFADQKVYPMRENPNVLNTLYIEN